MIAQLYKNFFSDLGFHQYKDKTYEYSTGFSYKLETGVGNGKLWAYSADDLYSIFIFKVLYNCNISVPVQYSDSPFLLVGLGYVSLDRKQSRPIATHDSLITYSGDNGEFIKQVETGTLEKYITVCITPKFYEDILIQYPDIGRFYKDGIFQLSINEHVPEIADVLNQLQTFRPLDAFARAYYDSKVTELVCLMVQFEMKKRLFPVNHSLPYWDKKHLEKLLGYLNKNFHKQIYIDALARQACMSRSKLTHLFKQAYGTTIPEYIKKLRINRAKEMLTDSNWQIETISNEVGYKLHGSFSQAFKQSTGYTPKQYRKNGSVSCSSV